MNQHLEELSPTWRQGAGRIDGGRLGRIGSSPLALLLLTVFCLGVSLEAAEGSPGLSFQAVDLEGNAFQGDSLRGKVVLLDFWATWCPPCIQAFPTLARWQREYGERGLQVVGIASYSGGYQEVSKFLKRHPADYTILVGSEDLAEQFEVIGFPTYFLLGRDGKVFGQYVGEMSFAKERLLADLEKLLEEPTRPEEDHPKNGR